MKLISSDENDHLIPDIFVVGLQETIALNAINVLKGHDQERIEIFIEIFIKNLNLKAKGKYKYECFSNQAMVGCTILGFC